MEALPCRSCSTLLLLRADMGVPGHATDAAAGAAGTSLVLMLGCSLAWIVVHSIEAAPCCTGAPTTPCTGFRSQELQLCKRHTLLKSVDTRLMSRSSVYSVHGAAV
jgi:hypothetical protein